MWERISVISTLCPLCKVHSLRIHYSICVFRLQKWSHQKTRSLLCQSRRRFLRLSSQCIRRYPATLWNLQIMWWNAKLLPWFWRIKPSTKMHKWVLRIKDVFIFFKRSLFCECFHEKVIFLCRIILDWISNVKILLCVDRTFFSAIWRFSQYLLLVRKTKFNWWKTDFSSLLFW